MKGVCSAEFGSLFEFIRNGMNIKQAKDVDGIPITRIETISDGTIDNTRVGYAGVDRSDAAKWLLEPGDILFSHINSVEHVGKCALYEAQHGQLVHGMNLLCLRPKQTVLSPNYAKWLIKSPAFRAALMPFINKAVNQASVSTTNLKGIIVSVPPLDEQKRIAAILDQADTIRRLRQRAIDRLNELGQAIFYEMFGQTNACVPLGSLIDKIESGKNLVADDSNSTKGFRVLKISAIGMSGFNAAETKPLPEDYVPPEDHVVKDGDLLFSRANTAELVGRAAIVDRAPHNTALPDKLWRIVPKERRVRKQFLEQLLRQPSVRAQISRVATGTSGSMKNISMEKLANIQVLCPPIVAQDEFVERVKIAKRQSERCQRQGRYLEDLFSSLQHRAFTNQL